MTEPSEPRDERMVRLAQQLQLAGVSQAVTAQLLAHDLDIIERQLAYLPYRKCRRPEAFLVEAIRKDYSPPKDFFYAANVAQARRVRQPLDQDSQPPY